MNSLQHLPLNTNPMKEIDSSITQYNNSILLKGLSTYKGVICIVLGIYKNNRIEDIDNIEESLKKINEIYNLEIDDETGEKWINVFFTRPYRSGDKGACERNHELFRYILVKGKP